MSASADVTADVIEKMRTAAVIDLAEARAARDVMPPRVAARTDWAHKNLHKNLPRPPVRNDDIAGWDTAINPDAVSRERALLALTDPEGERGARYPMAGDVAEASLAAGRLVDGVAETREDITPPDGDWPAAPDAAAYHGIAGTLIHAVAEYTEADPVGLLGTFLSVFGTLAGNGWSLHQGDWQHTNLFVALVGDTSTARKGTAFGAVNEMYKLVDPDWYGILVPGLGSGEGLITYLNGHKDDPRALVFETEFGRLLTAMTREGSTLSPIIRNAWDGVPLGRHVASATQSGKVDDHHVGVLANITNVELAQKLTSTESANGFGNRFLWLAVRRQHKVPFTEPIAGHVSPFVGSLKKSIEFGQGRGNMQLDPAAKVRWEEFYQNRPPRAGLIGALTGRAEPYVARLAMVYALLDQSSTIAVEHLQAAEAVWGYAERSAVYIFGDSTGDRHADALLRLLREQSPITWEEIRKELGLHRAAEIEAVVGLLERLGRVRLVKVVRPTSGRPRREVELIS